MPTTQTMTTAQSRTQRLMPLLKEILEETSGLELADTDESATFLELGLDSLTLTQVGLALQKKFNVKVTFRQLLKELPNLLTLADFMDRQLPAEAFPSETAPATSAEPIVTPTAPAIPASLPNAATPQAMAPQAVAPQVMVPQAMVLQPGMMPLPTIVPAPQMAMPGTAPSSALEAVINQQLHLMARQLELLSGSPSAGYGVMAPQVAPVHLPGNRHSPAYSDAYGSYPSPSTSPNTPSASNTVNPFSVRPTAQPTTRQHYHRGSTQENLWCWCPN